MVAIDSWGKFFAEAPGAAGVASASLGRLNFGPFWLCSPRGKDRGRHVFAKRHTIVMQLVVPTTLQEFPRGSGFQELEKRAREFLQAPHSHRQNDHRGQGFFGNGFSNWMGVSDNFVSPKMASSNTD